MSDEYTVTSAMPNIRTLPPRTRALQAGIATVRSREVRTRTAQWYRDVAELKREQPFCVTPAARGEQVVATQTDHVVPLVQGGTNDKRNLQRLCDACHGAKTAAEQDKRFVY